MHGCLGMYVCGEEYVHMSAVTLRAQKRVQDLLELGLQVVMGCQIWVGEPSLGLYQSFVKFLSP